MLRTYTARIITSAPFQARGVSSTVPRFIKVRSPKSPTPPSSPAERPPLVPDEISTPEPFEPIVNHPGGRPPTAEDISELEASIGTPELPLNPDLSSLPSLDIDPEQAAAIAEPASKEGAKQERTGASKKEYVSSIERQRRLMSRLGIGALLVGGVGAAYYLGNKDGQPKEGSAWDRFKSNFTELSDYFSKPAFTKLLPDPLPAPHQRPYTLLVDLEGLLVHSSWDRQSGWRTAKRPGVDYFLAYLSQFYEIVLFTNQPVYTALSVAEKLDPFTVYLPYKLFRESTRYIDGKVVKDLSYLNRDLSKVVLLDTNADHASLQPENAIIIKPWDGKSGDKGLVEMIPFLESIGIFSPSDVRPVLKHYAGKDIPSEYAKKEAEAKQLAVEEWERKHPTPAAGAGSGFLSGLFGGVSNPGQVRPNQPMTYLEIKRAQYQRAYEEEQKYYKEHAEEFMKMIEEDKQRQMAEMKGSIMGFFTGGEQSQVNQAEGDQAKQ